MKITIILAGSIPYHLIEIKEDNNTSLDLTKCSTLKRNKKVDKSIKSVKIVKKKTKKSLTKKK